MDNSKLSDEKTPTLRSHTLTTPNAFVLASRAIKLAGAHCRPLHPARILPEQNWQKQRLRRNVIGRYRRGRRWPWTKLAPYFG